MHPFFELLFDSHEFTCFADNPKGTRVQSVDDFNATRHAFFAINPLDGKKDRVPLEAYHHPNKPRRADRNVTVFRNILIEMDKGPLSEQWATIAKLDMPYSTCVYSGGKSYHFIISLEEPCEDRESYDALVKRIYSVLGDRIDPACKNPSRLSRCPGYYREEKDKYQNLNDMRARVPRADLEAWLNSHDSFPEEKPSFSRIDTVLPRDLYRSTLKFLSEGAPEGEWNNTLFKAACDAFAKGWSKEEFLERAEQITGHLDPSDHSTIRSAWVRTGQKAS